MKKVTKHIEKIREFYALSATHPILMEFSSRRGQPIEYLDGITGALLATYRQASEKLQMNNRVMDSEELLLMAQYYYNDGGDGVVECWDQQMYDTYTALFGPITYKVAMKIIHLKG